MSDNTMTVDARGLSCPQPVLETKKAIDSASDQIRKIEVLVDTVTSRENVKRFASSHGWHADAAEDGSHYRVDLSR